LLRYFGVFETATKMIDRSPKVKGPSRKMKMRFEKVWEELSKAWQSQAKTLARRPSLALA